MKVQNLRSLTISEQVKLIELLPHRVQVLLAIEWAQNLLIHKQHPKKPTRSQRAFNLANNYVISLEGDSEKLNKTANDCQFNTMSPERRAAAHAICAAFYSFSGAYDNIPYNVITVFEYSIHHSDNESWLQSTYNWTKGPTYPFNPEWRTTTAIQLAKQILVNKELEVMPILADALQDTGFTDTNWLSYLQSGRDEWVKSNWLIWNLLELNTDKPVT